MSFIVVRRREKRKRERRSQKKAGNVRGSRVLHKHRCSVIYDATLYDFLYTRVSYMYYLFTRAQNEGKRRRTRACVGSRTRRIFSDASALFSPRGGALEVVGSVGRGSSIFSFAYASPYQRVFTGVHSVPIFPNNSEAGREKMERKGRHVEGRKFPFSVHEKHIGMLSNLTEGS